MPLFAYQPEGLMATAIFVIVSTVAFAALVKTEIGVWWSLLFAALTGVTVLVTLAAWGYVADLTERFRERRKHRPGGPTRPDIP